MALNVQNLKPFGERPVEEQRAIRTAGGKASGEARRRKRAIREICGDLLGMAAPLKAVELGELADVAQKLAAERGQELDLYEAMTLAQLAQALQGDVKAATFVRDSAGDKPTDQVEASVAALTDGDMALLRKMAERMGLDATNVQNR